MEHKRILVISPIPTHPRNAGHRERIYQMVRQIQRFGHDVHLLHVTLEADGDVEAMQACWGDHLHLFQYEINRTSFNCSPSFHATLMGKCIRRLGFIFEKNINFPYSVDDWYDPACEAVINKLQSQFSFEVVIAEYVFMSKALTMFDSKTRKIIDTHDVFSNRGKLFQLHHQTPSWYYTTKRQEIRGLRRADVIFAIQKHEHQIFQQFLPEKAVETIGHFAELQALPLKTGTPLTLLFLASSNQMNLHGLRWFMQQVWPLLHTQQADVRMLLAGTICNVFEEHPAVTKLGRFQDAKAIYIQADIVISPILFGTGLKIKNVEAMSYGKALVTTPVGAEGLEQGEQSAFFAATTAEEFANCIIKLLTNSELRYAVCQRAYSFAEKLQQENLSTLSRILQFDHESC